MTDAKLAVIDALDGDVFTECPIKDGKTLRDEIVNGFGTDDENRLIGSAMELRMCAEIAVDAVDGSASFGNRALGDASTGNVDLDNGA